MSLIQLAIFTQKSAPFAVLIQGWNLPAAPSKIALESTY